jgi:hypothetical protein
VSTDRKAGEVFEVSHVIYDGEPTVKLTVETPENTAELFMAPESALWLALQLWRASGLPLDHNLRFRRRAES